MSVYAFFWFVEIRKIYPKNPTYDMIRIKWRVLENCKTLMTHWTWTATAWWRHHLVHQLAQASWHVKNFASTLRRWKGEIHVLLLGFFVHVNCTSITVTVMHSVTSQVSVWTVSIKLRQKDVALQVLGPMMRVCGENTRRICFCKCIF